MLSVAANALGSNPALVPFCGRTVMRFLVSLALCVTVVSAAATQEVRPKIDYNRQIRPILSDKCYRCHGPDAGERKAGFRFDQRNSAIGKAESGETPIVPGKADQ